VRFLFFSGGFAGILIPNPRLYANLQSNQEWMDDLHNSDVVLVGTHSQGSVVSTHLLDRLIRDNHIRVGSRGRVPVPSPSAAGLASLVLGTSPSASVQAQGHRGEGRKPHRICCLALCGIHLGPLRYLKSSSLVKPYIQVRAFRIVVLCCVVG
jgi:hypothetical protein